MNWITLGNGERLNMEQVVRVHFGEPAQMMETRYVEVFWAGGGYHCYFDAETWEQLEEWMTDNSEVLE